jgi:ComF family protein
MLRARHSRPFGIPPWLKRGAETALGLLLPRRCLACGATVESDGALCVDCWPQIRFLGSPCCGFPFEYDQGSDALCAGCAGRRPVYARARAVFAYDDASRGPVLAFKHADRIDAAPAFVRMMVQAAGDLLEGAPLITPVPLHRSRLMMRRYNQAAVLANALTVGTGLSVVPDLLVRRRRTPSQGHLGGAARRRNVQGAFAVCASRKEALRGRRILLVDDVMTTGATVEACARPLLRAGADAVDVLTLARVIRAATI